MILHQAKEEYIWQGDTKLIYLGPGGKKEKKKLIGSDPELEK